MNRLLEGLAYMNTIQTQAALTKLAWTRLYIMYYIYCIYALVITWFSGTI